MKKDDKKNLTKLINDTFFSQDDSKGMSITLYTGVTGYYMFNLMMVFRDIPSCKYWFHTYKRIHKKIHLSLVEKHGMWKARISSGKAEIYYGTNLVTVLESFKDLPKYIEKHITHDYS